MTQPLKYLRHIFNTVVVGGLLAVTAWLSPREGSQKKEFAFPASSPCLELIDHLGGPPGIRIDDAPLEITKHKSRNYEQRFTPIKYIVLHYTATKDHQCALNALTTSVGKGSVSSHYLVDEKGGILNLVDENFVAWHAGTSYWDGDPRINDYSIGIEIQNRSKEPFSYPQMQAVIKLCKDVMERYGIPPENVIGHSDVAPDRKSDPGEYFPWRAFAQHGVGIWPEETVAPPPGTDYMNIFRELGYGTKGRSEKQLITAFQQHFDPKTYANSSQVGVMTSSTFAKLYSVALKKREIDNPLSLYNKHLVANLQLKVKPPIL